MVKFVSLAASALALFSGASAARVSRMADGDTFSLYAYGTNMGGYSLMAKDGLAYLASSTVANSTEFNLEAVTFTISGTSWLASSTGSSLPSGSIFFIPGQSDVSNLTGFTTSANSTVITSDFFMFGPDASHTNSATGMLDSLFYAVPTGTAGLSLLAWNVTDTSAGAIPVRVRTVAPSSPATLVEE